MRLGELARRMGLFLTKDELAPTAGLAALTAFDRAVAVRAVPAPAWHPAPAHYRVPTMQPSFAGE